MGNDIGIPWSKVFVFELGWGVTSVSTVLKGRAVASCKVSY